MIIHADNKITQATVTATNVLSYANEDRLKIFQLDNKMRISQGVTKIIIDYMSNIPDINSVILCGTNISPSATVTLSYSSVDPDTLEATIALSQYSTFNQAFVLPATYNKRYWIININDPDYQGEDAIGVEIGYIYIGKSINVEAVQFPYTPALNIVSRPSTSATAQEYGSKWFNQNSMEFTAILDDDSLEDILSIIEDKQNIDPVVVIPFEDSITNRYRPRYGVLSQDSYPYPMVNNPGSYELALTHRETF